MSVSAILRAAPIATSAELMQPETVRHHEMFDRGALKPLLDREVPVLVDHVKDDAPIGRVKTLRTDPCWTGGTWLWVHAEITDPPTWLRTGSGVSISRSALHTRDMGGWDLIRRGLLSEVSILSPGVEPVFPEAQVVWIGEPPASRTDRLAAGEVIIHDPPVLVRRYYPTEITIS